GWAQALYPQSGLFVALAWLDAAGGLLSGPLTSVPGFGVDVAVDGSGRAVVAAQRYEGDPVYDQDFNVIGYTGASPSSPTEVAALRVLPGGALDASFGTAGIAAVAVPTAFDASATSVAIQPDGRIVLAASGTIPPTSSASDILVLRLLSGGAPDTTFAG